MSVETYLTNLFQLLPPGETLVLTREKWEWMVAHHGGAAREDSTVGRPEVDRGRSERALYFVSDLAREFDVAESTMRAFLSKGLCGNPSRLRPVGKGKNLDGVSKRFEVPAPLVAAVREALARGQVLGTFSILPNVALRAAHGAPERPAQSSTPDDEESTTPLLKVGPATPASGPAPTAGDRASRSSLDAPTAAKHAKPAPAPRRPRPQVERAPTAPKPDLGSWRKHARSA